MKISWNAAANFIIVAVMFVVGLYVYPRLPVVVASHWDNSGQVNGYMPKFWGTFMLPVITLLIFGFFYFIPKIDPKRANISKFKKYYDIFILATLIFMAYVYVLTLAWNLGYRFSFTALLSPAFGLLYYAIGVAISHAKQNWFIGIRTPWTLSSEVVWNKTHEIGGEMFKSIAFFPILGLLLPNYIFWFVAGPAVFVSVLLVIYSYIDYKNEDAPKSHQKIR